MDTFLHLTAILAVIMGAFFSVVGVVGFVRLPDVYTRLHATGKVAVFGVVLYLVAAVAVEPLGWGRGLVLIALLLITNPVTAHAIASAAHRMGLPRVGAERDDLAQLSTASGIGATQTAPQESEESAD
jgi:multicomponent Na+:H+ antiporter subunit G